MSTAGGCQPMSQLPVRGLDICIRICPVPCIGEKRFACNFPSMLCNTKNTMKRCANLMPPPSERPTKSQRKSSSHRINVVKETKNVNIEETESARQQALPYLLATARIPIRVLTAEWKIGQNRSLDFDHVQDLCSAFRNKALKRTAYDNYLFVSGRRESVHKMKEHLQGAGRTGEEPLPFDDWADVNPEERLEIIAGQHRLAALEELGQQDGFHEEALWWTCEIYDQGKSAPTCWISSVPMCQ